MDRFSERESEFQDDVPKNPMSKFVRSAPSQPEGFAKVEIQASKREQKKQASAVSQSSNPQTSGMSTARPQSSAPVPGWAAVPPTAATLQVFKDSKLVDTIALNKAMTVFGRGQAADVVLDHQSLSRQHASICYHKMTAKWLVMDLSSVHGTACDGKPVPKRLQSELVQSRSAELKDGCKLQFGASTRVFVFQRTAKASPSQLPDTSSSGRAEGSDPVRRASGPQSSSSPGRFADLVQQTFLEDRAGSRAVSVKKAADPNTKRPSVAQPLRRGLYDSLPSPEQM